ncbi:hypothetical protein OIE68_36655 [Nocardia vinacea]|uniref:hypothetical protein n=1 Tax=Nocardia vinacea TaxID=96468 RepID=UPI002E157614|nr:hypothetical protein OIE68_36655 [Nocardia vinacea]
MPRVGGASSGASVPRADGASSRAGGASVPPEVDAGGAPTCGGGVSWPLSERFSGTEVGPG